MKKRVVPAYRVTRSLVDWTKVMKERAKRKEKTGYGKIHCMQQRLSVNVSATKKHDKL